LRLRHFILYDISQIDRSCKISHQLFVKFYGLSGIGEQILPLSPAPSVWLVLLQPCDGLSTKEIFTAYDSPDRDLLISRPRTGEAQKALLTGDLTGLGAAMDNVLEAISAAKRPAIRAAGQLLEAAGAIRAMMTGSGSVVYGVFPDRESAANAHALLAAKALNPLLTCTAETGIREIDQF
jgi:4-diphosphocytidyl-2-C-methyl-D-erythritol kinase